MFYVALSCKLREKNYVALPPPPAFRTFQYYYNGFPACGVCTSVLLEAAVWSAAGIDGWSMDNCWGEECIEEDGGRVDGCKAAGSVKHKKGCH